MVKTGYLQEVEKKIHSAPGKWVSKDVPFLKKYIGTQYDIKGLSIPGVRSIYKTGFSFSKDEMESQMEIWDAIWQQSKLHEALSLAIFFWEKNRTEIEPEKSWQYLKKCTGKIDNWAHSDGLSALYAHLFEQEPELLFPQYKKWNYSGNPWERRQSVVGLIHYHRQRSKVLPYSKLIPLVESLLNDDHYYVQKGVGWALREIGNIYPTETYRFLKKNNGQITGIAFSAASEKLSKEEKEELKSLRKAGRKKITPA